MSEREVQQYETDTQQVSEITGWWEVAVRDAEGNPTIQRLHRHTTKTRPLPDGLLEDFKPASPARITPSRRKPVERDYKSLFVFSDAQIDYRRIIDHETQETELVPLHDERAMKLARFICRDLRPDYIINLGDSVDLAALSRFKADSDHFQATIGPSFQRMHDYYAELRADNPDARILEVDSNHNVRLKNFMLKNAPQLYGVHRAGEKDKYPVMSYPYLANLGHLGVEWYGGYGSAEFVYNDELHFRHGTLSNSRSSTAAKASDPEVSVIQGHAHRAEIFHRTNRAGKYLASIVVPALCRTDGVVPSYWSAINDENRPVKHQENWQQGAMHIRDYGGGNYQYDMILFRDGQAFYNGKEYGGE